jgi:hypothetical protein
MYFNSLIPKEENISSLTNTSKYLTLEDLKNLLYRMV